MSELVPGRRGWSVGNAINERAMVVGDMNFPGSGPGFSSSRAFVWTPAGGSVMLGTLTGEDYRSTSASDINERGQIVGAHGNGSDNQPTWQAVMWTPEGWMV